MEISPGWIIFHIGWIIQGLFNTSYHPELNIFFIYLLSGCHSQAITSHPTQSGSDQKTLLPEGCLVAQVKGIQGLRLVPRGLVFISPNPPPRAGQTFSIKTIFQRKIGFSTKVLGGVCENWFSPVFFNFSIKHPKTKQLSVFLWKPKCFTRKHFVEKSNISLWKLHFPWCTIAMWLPRCTTRGELPWCVMRDVVQSWRHRAWSIRHPNYPPRIVAAFFITVFRLKVFCLQTKPFNFCSKSEFSVENVYGFFHFHWNILGKTPHFLPPSHLPLINIFVSSWNSKIMSQLTFLLELDFSGSLKGLMQHQRCDRRFAQ